MAYAVRQVDSDICRPKLDVIGQVLEERGLVWSIGLDSLFLRIPGYESQRLLHYQIYFK